MICPYFIFLSGLVVKTKRLSGKNTFIDCYRRFRVLLVPFLLVGLTYTLFQGYSIDNFFVHSMKRGYWCLLALFDLYMVHYFFQSVVGLIPRKFQITSDVILYFILSFLFFIYKDWVMEVNILVVLGIDKMVMYFPIFYGAVLINKYGFQKNMFGSKKVHFISLFVLRILSLLIVLDIQFRGIYTLMMLFGIIAILCTLYKCSNSTGIIANLASYVGERTLDIYIFHFFIIGFISLDFLSGVLTKYNSLFLSCCIVFPISFVIILLSILLGEIIRKSDILNHLIFYK